jgi:amino acid transporter
MGLTLLSAISFGMLAKEMPSAGGIYTWSRAALGETLGLWIGLNTIIYYLVCLTFAPIVFGQFFNEVLVQLGVSFDPKSSFWLWSWLAGALAMLAAAAYVAYRGIVVSAHMAFTLLLIELAVVVAMAATFIGLAVYHGQFTLAPVTFGACKSGWQGVFLALPMGMMCMVCDAAIPASEETSNAKWTIPVAVVLTCLIVGIWYVVGFSAFAMGRTPADDSVSLLQNGVAPMAQRAWGDWRILVSLTAMSAALGSFIPIVTAASRMMFAMAREKKLPRAFAELHPRFLAPWNAIHFAFAFTLLAVVPAVFAFGPNHTIEWWGNTIGWFIGVVYIAANIVHIVYYWRFKRARFNIFLNGLFPGVAIAFEIWFVWQSAIIALWERGWMGRSAQLFIAIASVAALLYLPKGDQPLRDCDDPVTAR